MLLRLKPDRPVAVANPRSSRRAGGARLALAFAVAGASDLASAVSGGVPPLQWFVDAVTALLLFLLLGRRWELLPALFAEAVPGLAEFPFWVLVVGSIAVADAWVSRRRGGRDSR